MGVSKENRLCARPEGQFLGGEKGNIRQKGLKVSVQLFPENITLHLNMFFSASTARIFFQAKPSLGAIIQAQSRQLLPEKKSLISNKLRKHMTLKHKIGMRGFSFFSEITDKQV